MKRPKLSGILSVLAILMVVSVGSVAAYGFGMGKNKGVDNEDIMTSLEAGNYDSWREAHIATLTEERFEEAQERHQHRMQFRNQNEAVREALEAGDYESWLEAHEGLSEMRHDYTVITEEDFNVLAQMHQARVEGDFDTANELAEELDWEFGPRQGMGMNKEGMRGQGKRMHQ